MVTRKGFSLQWYPVFKGFPNGKAALTAETGTRRTAVKAQREQREPKDTGRKPLAPSVLFLNKTLIKKKGRSAKSELCIFHYADLPQTGKVKNPQARFPPFPARPASSFLRFRRSCFLPCPVHRKRAERVGALVPSFSILYKTVGGKGMGAAQISFHSLILRSVFRSHMRRASPSSSG